MLFLNRGNPKKFHEEQVSFKDFIPRMLISIIPIIIGIYLLFQGSSWFVFGLTVWPVIIWFFGNPILFGELACPNYKQADIYCPVCEYFKKKELEKRKRLK